MELTPQCGEMIVIITARYAGAFGILGVYFGSSSKNFFLFLDIGRRRWTDYDVSMVYTYSSEKI